MIRRARDAGFRQLQELRAKGDVEAAVIDRAKDNAGRMWHSLGFQRRDGAAEQNAQQFDNWVTVNALKGKRLAAERQGRGRRP